MNSGADDYQTKAVSIRSRPYGKSHIAAARYPSLGRMATEKGVIQTVGLVLDDMKKTVTVDGEIVKLTPMEYKNIALSDGYHRFGFFPNANL